MSGPWEKFQQKPQAKPWEKFAKDKPSAKEAYEAMPWYQQAAQATDDIVRMLANGMTLGYADKIAGYMGGEGTEAERAKSADAADRAVSAGIAAEILGTLAPTSALGRAVGAAGLAGSNLLGRTVSLGGQGALLGGGQALGTDQDVATGVGLGAASGVAGNLAGDSMSALLSRLFGVLNKAPKTMTLDELKAAGQRAYQNADNAGVIYRPEAIDRLRSTIYDDFAEFGFHPKNQPGAAVAYDEMTRLAEGGNVSMKGLDTARKVTLGGLSPTNPSNNALLGKVAERIDDFAESAGPGDILTGNSQAASAAMKEARDYWSRFRKLDKVQGLLERAGLQAGSTGSGGNIENATRQQLKRILTDKKLMRGFTADEKAAVRKAVLGTNTQNALRLAGKLSPQGNGLMLALGGATTALNPMIGLPAMAAGYGAKKLSEVMTAKNAEMVKRLIAAGGKKSALVAPPNAAQRLAQSERDALSRLFATTGVVLTGR